MPGASRLVLVEFCYPSHALVAPSPEVSSNANSQGQDGIRSPPAKSVADRCDEFWKAWELTEQCC